MPMSTVKGNLAQDFTRKGKQCQVAGTFDCYGHLALVLRAGSGLPASTDFAILVDKAAQHIIIFIINDLSLICAELAGAGAIKSLLALESAFGSVLASLCRTSVVHNWYSSWYMFGFTEEGGLLNALTAHLATHHPFIFEKILRKGIRPHQYLFQGTNRWLSGACQA